MVPLQKFLGEALARFQLRRSLRRPKRPPPAPRELIDHAESKRQFRPNDGQIRLQTRRQRRNRLQALQVRRHALRIVGDAAVPRRAIKL